MQNQIIIATIIVSAFTLIMSILFQKKGGGPSSTFGGTGSGVYKKKRGAEKVVFYLTIVSAIIFCGSVLVSLTLNN